MAEYEREGNMCEECGEREANYTIAVMMGEQVTHRQLCSVCMAKMNMNLTTGNLKQLLSGLMNSIVHRQEDREGVESGDAPVCERCGTTFDAFEKTGRLGCAQCYQAFREQLAPMLRQLHGHLQHTGRKLLNDEDAQRQRAACERLNAQLTQAVEQEDFETAARLRDELRQLSGAEGGIPHAQ